MAIRSHGEANHFVEGTKRKDPPLGSGPFPNVWIADGYSPIP